MPSDVQSSIVSKCAIVIDKLAESHSGMTFTEIVASTDFNKSSVHRIISVLLGEELLHHDAARRTYSLGKRSMQWARSAWQKIDLQQITDAELAQLRDTTGLNVAVSIPTDDAVLFIRTLNLSSFRYAAKVGEDGSMHGTAAGKIFLAYSPSQDRCGLPEGYELERLTEYTITNMRNLEIELTKVRRLGYAMADREEFLQVNGIAAPVFDYQNRVVASVGLWAPTKSAQMDAVLEHVGRLTSFAAEISGRFGLMGSSPAGGGIVS
jgi:DNA-binding IclR family transcriptional regulator